MIDCLNGWEKSPYAMSKRQRERAYKRALEDAIFDDMPPFVNGPTSTRTEILQEVARLRRYHAERERRIEHNRRVARLKGWASFFRRLCTKTMPVAHDTQKQMATSIQKDTLLEGHAMKVCAITGHRPTRFSFGYDERDPLCIQIKKALLQELARLYDEQRVRDVWVGGALGVDLWAGEAVLALQNEGRSDLILHVAIPFDGHDSAWPLEHRKRLAQMCAQAEVQTICPSHSQDAFRRRNHFRVDASDVLIAVYAEDGGIKRSGTGQTVRYAQLRDIPIIYIHPDTAEVLKGTK